MAFVVAILLLLAFTVGWLVFRAFTNRSYVKGRYRRAPEPDGHIEAEEQIYEEQMKVRLEYYRMVRENAPEIKRMGETIICSDDLEAAAPIFAELKRLFGENPPSRTLGALAVLKNWDYRTVWYLDGLSDIVKAAIFEHANGKTMFLREYGVIVARADDMEGFRHAYCEQDMNS